MIRLSIYQNGDSFVGGFTPWWDNIYEHLANTIDKEHQDLSIMLGELLAEWGAVSERIDNRGYVSFENEEDVVMFLLRWS